MSVSTFNSELGAFKSGTQTMEQGASKAGEGRGIEDLELDEEREIPKLKQEMDNPFDD